ncbi:MAG TPA: hypothetical protein DCZ94_08805 [Lentisphaeria bacterium]|nr:MAG: hypothetical protein A2X48_23595 [Lentisphaerae bacterium GWF2_49_21]HBC87039.1 hypothetical protein [Lentisphaeria bacterium]
MKTRKYELTQLDILALREATELYWHEVSKKVLERGRMSPAARRMHDAARALYDRFKQDCMLM